MVETTITVEAVFENGVLRPLQPLPLTSRQQVTLTLHVPKGTVKWPDDVAAIYQEIAEEDQRIAGAMWEGVRRTWPADEEPS
jgi:predicted DNA-binding antitoxin AbrB/MazE fold protein